MKHLCARMKTGATILCSRNGALNLLLLGENSPKMSKNAQKWKVGSRGNAKCSVPVRARPIKLRLSNVPKAALQKCAPDHGSQRQPFRRYCRFSSKITIFGRFQRVFFASISTPRPVWEKLPPTNPNHLSIYTRMPSFRKIVGLFFEISVSMD